MITWTSELIELATATVDVKADTDGVIFGAQSNGTLLVDLHITPEQACAIADALTQGAAKCLEARGRV